MKLNLVLMILIFSVISCKENKGDQPKIVTQENLEPVADINELTADYKTWWSYHYYDISLSSDFKAVNENSEIISKEEFLKKLTSGKFIPIEIKTDNNRTYKLYKLPQNIDKAIASTIKSTSTGEYQFYKMAGQKFPEINFIDLSGNSYTNDSLIGKTTIIKTWFIACKPCIEEMPELNNVVDKYKLNKNLQFLSLATDSQQPLTDFLKKTEFKYKVVAEQKDLIQNKLNLRAYPTHLIVDEGGKIEKVFNTAPELIAYIEGNETFKKIDANGSLPPPPPPPPAPIQ